MEPTTISVLGLGYIGLPTAGVLCRSGFKVFGTDIDKRIVDGINRGQSHISEPDLSETIHAASQKGLLKASLDVSAADIHIICVPTPLQEEHYPPEPDVSFVLDAVDKLIPVLKEGDLIILESTSPLGTTDRIEAKIKMRFGESFNLDIAYCPERVLPGHILREIVENDRIVGGTTAKASARAAKFYRSFVTGRIHQTNARTAELCKLTENSFRDVNIAFANELSMICESQNVDVKELIQLANHHPRVNILSPGPGVGGHCIAVDPWFIVSGNPSEAKLIREARETNRRKTDWVVSEIVREIKKFRETFRRDPTVGCLGLTFKPDVDDLRGSPALEITLKLRDMGANVLAVEPNIEEHELLNLVGYEAAATKSDILIFLVAHQDFKLRGQVPTSGLVLDYCGLL